MKKKSKINLQNMHPYVILLLLLLFASLMTYVVPAGVYDRIPNDMGQNIADPNSFHYIDATPIAPWMLFSIIVETLGKNGGMIFPLILIGGALEVVVATRMFHALSGKLVIACAGREKLFIPVIMLVFSLIGITQGPNKFIAFAPLGVMLATTLGFDAIVGVAIIIVSMGVGLGTGIIEPGTALAQQIAELPAYSGMWLRVVSFIILYVVSTVAVVRYAGQIQKDKTKSYVYKDSSVLSFETGEGIPVTKVHYMVLGTFVISLVILVFGCVKYNWGLNETAVVFLWMAAAVGVLAGFGINDTCRYFVDGMKNMSSSGIMLGIALAIGTVLTKANILDTVVHALANMMIGLPIWLMAPAMLLVNNIVNFFVISGVGQAGVVMPIMAPLADIVGVSRQTCVLAFKFGDGFSNYIYPHSSSLAGFLAATGISYSKWMKFMWKIFAMQMAVCCLILIFAQIVHY